MQRPLFLALCLLACACHRDPPVVAVDPLAGAKALIESKDYSAAIETLEALRTQGGDDPKVAVLLMEAYNHQNDPARAILRGRAALEAHPDAKPLYIALSELYTRAGQYPTAHELLLEARKRGVDDRDVSFRLGTCLAFMDDRAGARAEYARALKAGYPEADVQFNLGLLAVRDQDRAAARAIFEDVVAKKPDFLKAQAELAHVILDQAILDASKTGKVDEAAVKKLMTTLWDLKDKMKDDWRVNESLGDGWFLLGDYDAALVSYTDALRLGQNPASVEARFREAATRKKDLAALRAKAPASDGASPK